MTKFIGVVSLFPEAFTALTEAGVVARALKSSEVQLQFFNPRDYSQDKHRRVDDQPYGGGQGMLLNYQPLAACLDAAIDACFKAGHKNKPPIIFFSPQGAKLNQGKAGAYVELSSMILLSGCYEGIDERIIESYVDEQLSIGDYVLSSGDLAIMVFINVVARLWQPTLGNELSAKNDSFSVALDGLLEEPYFTRPELVKNAGKHARPGVNLRVPQQLGGGNHAEIAKWKRSQALQRTWRRRPELLRGLTLADKKLLLDNN